LNLKLQICKKNAQQFMNKIRLAIIDDHAVVLDGLKTMLNAFEKLEIVYTTQSGHNYWNIFIPMLRMFC
jgi:hypothetical protein